MRPATESPPPATARSTLPPRDAYELWAASYGENRNPVQVLEAGAVDRLLPNLDGLDMLDCGCGTGRVARLAAGRGARRVCGLDASRAMIEKARAVAPAIEWAVGDACSLPWEDQVFDGVTCSLVLGHVADLDAALREIARVLRPGGFLLATDFHPYATLRGWQRTFTAERDGRSYAIEQHLHLFEDYQRCFHDQRLQLEALEEPRYEDFPVVFALRARKATGG